LGLRVPALDKELGMSVYATDSEGIGGAIRGAPEDFQVEEVLVDGSIASTSNTTSKPALGASSSKQRFLLCILVKRRWDTFAAIKAVAKHLGIDETRIHIAGIKDAKAVTAQHVAIENVAFDDAAKVDVKDIELRPIGYFRDALSPFYLLGNRFTISINHIERSEADVELRVAETVSELEAQGGIPNFFGHQRFGTTRAITHLVGRAIVNGNLQEAAMMFLAKPSPYEHPESRVAREALLATQDFTEALKAFPRQLRFERLMLHHLVENPADFAGAFQRLPRKLQLLFVQAYQAFLFNCFLSQRLHRGFSLNVAEVGDYVVSVERSGLPMPKSGKLVTSKSVADVNVSIKAGKLRVALPLVGFGQRLSEGEMGRIEAETLEEESVESACFRVRELPRISGKGELRAVVSPVRDFRIEDVSHDDETPRLCRVKLSFMLFRGSYATMLLREVMKPQNPLTACF
jgi:tRNA pseudouridine13 synthase